MKAFEFIPTYEVENDHMNFDNITEEQNDDIVGRMCDLIFGNNVETNTIW